MAKDTIQDYIDTFKSWKQTLQPYWKSIDKNSEMYEFYKRENSETQSQILLNTPFAIVESMVSKANESNLVVTVNAEGESGLQDLEKWISSILKSALEDKKVARLKGSLRKIREKFFREFLVKGNAVASVEWLRKEDSSGKLVVCNPYVRFRNLKSVIFNPTKTLCDSDVYYLESWVKYSDLKGNPLYSNLGKLKELANKKDIEIDDEVYYSDGVRIVKKGEPIRILERWEGTDYKVIADDSIVIREEDDPFKLGGHNLITAMNYVVGDRPYAYGEIDAIYMTVRAQDRVVNQSIDIINRYLRDAYLVDPLANMDLDEVADLLENGGAMEGKANMVSIIPTNVPPTAAFQTVDTLQQAIERTERFSPYSTGVPNSAVDKTAGTATGIQTMQQASEPNFQIKLDALEESFMEPIAMNFLTMIANLMSPTEFRYGMLQGKTSEWVKAGKNVLLGKPTMKDLLAIGYTTPETSLEYTHTLQPTDQVDVTGQPLQDIVPIPGADKAVIFDIDWIVDVKLNNQAQAIKQKEVSELWNWATSSQQIGAPVNPEKISLRAAEVQGIDDPKDLLKTPEELQQEQQAMMQQQQTQQQTQQQGQQGQQQSQMEMQQAKMQHEKDLMAMKLNNM